MMMKNKKPKENEGMKFKIIYGDGTSEIVIKESFSACWKYVTSKSKKFAIESA